MEKEGLPGPAPHHVAVAGHLRLDLDLPLRGVCTHSGQQDCTTIRVEGEHGGKDVGCWTTRNPDDSSASAKGRASRSPRQSIAATRIQRMPLRIRLQGSRIQKTASKRSPPRDFSVLTCSCSQRQHCAGTMRDGHDVCSGKWWGLLAVKLSGGLQLAMSALCALG